MAVAEKVFKVTDGEELKLIKNARNKYYNFSLHLGSRMSWRGKSGGEWRRDEATDDPINEKLGYLHTSASHLFECINGEILNGLIVSNNIFLEANKKNDLKCGDVSLMVCVSDIKECEAPEKKFTIMQEELIKMMKTVATVSAEAAVKAAFEAMKK